VAEAKSRVGLDRLEIRPDPPALRKQAPGIEIDLASVAKGYAVDLACETLDQMGVSDYCIEVGGEVRTKGLNARGLPWQIAIESPAAEGGFHCMVPLSGQAMATSGDYRIYGEQDGARFPHIIDPRTGRPVRHDLASVSVIDPSCARADAWATVLMVAGPEAGYELAVREKLPGLFIERTHEGFIERTLPGFPLCT
jgi:thiamine biosynthesis lipoprotein